jgi:phosphoenolpyruvate carboxykinase (ATP)
MKYAQVLRQLIQQSQAKVWLVNTGWSGGSYGIGSRFSLKYTRAIIDAILENKLQDARFETDPFFGLSFPQECPELPAEVLNPKNTWRDKEKYDQTANKLAALFKDNFKTYEDQATPEVIAAGPIV